MKLAAILAAALVAIAANSACASPLDTGSWYQIARLADGDAGMFDGNGNLGTTYSFGAFSSASQTSSRWHQRVREHRLSRSRTVHVGGDNPWLRRDWISRVPQAGATSALRLAPGALDHRIRTGAALLASLIVLKPWAGTQRRLG